MSYPSCERCSATSQLWSNILQKDFLGPAHACMHAGRLPSCLDKYTPAALTVKDLCRQPRST